MLNVYNLKHKSTYLVSIQEEIKQDFTHNSTWVQFITEQNLKDKNSNHVRSRLSIQLC